MTPLRILDTAPPGLAAITRDLTPGVVTIDSPGRVALAAAQPVTVSDGSGQVIGSWFDTLARPRVIEFTGTLTVTGTGLMAVWNSTRTTGSPYSPMSNYTPASWQIATGTRIINASTAGSVPVLTIADGVNSSSVESNAIVSGGTIVATTDISAPGVGGFGTAVVTPLLYNNVPGSFPGVYCNDPLRVSGTLTLNGPIVSNSTSNSTFTSAVQAPSFLGNATSATSATYASTAGSAGDATTADYLDTTFAGPVPSGYGNANLYGVVFDPGSNQIYLSFIYAGNSYIVSLGGVVANP